MYCILYENVVLLVKNFSIKGIVQKGLFYKQFMIEYVAYLIIYKLQCLILGGFNLEIYSQNIYEVIENNIRKHVLIIYNISENHYVGLTVHTTKSDNITYIESINRFIDINDLQEYTKRNIKRISLY